MSQITQKTSPTVQAQVEALTTVAKKLHAEGNEAPALEAYKTASGLMPGAPWLQHRTAELARKLKQPEVAALHYRRAASAFVGAGFPKRALAPLRTSWQVSIGLLPGAASGFISTALELCNLQRELGFAADAKITLANSNQALRASGSVERMPAEPEPKLRRTEPRVAEASQPPESGVTSVAATMNGLLSRGQAAVKP